MTDEFRITRRAFNALGVASLLAPCISRAQQPYPARPVKVVVTYTPGGANDISARIYAHLLSQDLNQPFVVENKPGASGITGTTYAARSEPDGYTLLLGAGGTMTINPGLFPKLSYDPLKDFTPIGIVARAPLVLVVSPKLPVKNVRELIAYAKSKPEGITFASPGPGTPLHLAGELFTRRTGINAIHIPYRGSAPALNDLMSGQVDMMFDVLSSSIGFINGDKLRALAVSSAERSSYLPDVPTAIEQGVKDFDITSWFGFFAPAGTPPEAIKVLTASLAKAAATPQAREQLAAMAMDPVTADNAALRELVQTEQARWREVIIAAKVKTE